jgi:hypothetical protein
MTKAESFCNSFGAEEMSNELLLTTAHLASGQDPVEYASLRAKDAGQFYFTFDDDSVLCVDIYEPGLRNLSVQ